MLTWGWLFINSCSTVVLFVNLWVAAIIAVAEASLSYWVF